VHIKAFLPASLIEYPGHIADVVYVGACNFRCPYCYNVDLVVRPEQLPDIELSRVLQRLEARRGFVDGLAITGGEPTVQSGLIAFLADVRQLGLSVKLDTNGYRPDVLQECLERRLVDYVAMDVKGSLARYEPVAGVAVDPKRLQQSIELLLRSEIDYEFRTTVVPGLVNLQDVKAIVDLIAGARSYYLQCFRPGETLGWGRDAPVGPPFPELVQEMAGLAASQVQVVGIRGLPQGANAHVHRS
jgi:pyruvate formate lyase activating enzyme